MSAYPPPSDDELHGYLDGELQPAQCASIETFLKSSPAHAERVEAWRRQRQIICAAFAPVEAEPTPGSVMVSPDAGGRAFLQLLRPGAHAPADIEPPAVPRPIGRKAAAAFWRAAAKPLAIAAIFTAGALAALAGAYFADRLHAPPTASRPAPDRSDNVLAARTLAALMDFKPQDPVSASGAALQASHDSHQASLIIPNLSNDGFALVGMRMAPAPSGEPADEMACLFYVKAPEAPVALCITRDPDGGRAGQFQIASKLPSDVPGGAISWRQANAVYSLAGPLEEKQLRMLAKRISAAIEAFD